ncbi:MAG: amidohydrolase family protein [Planctomycetes bacterium]|nr:amidohydrolase family protein [Planctomycetota bacterium]
MFDFPFTERYALAARWIAPVDRPPLENAWVAIASGRIVDVGVGPAPQPCLNLGHVLLLPGLVNAHTHLEFSALHAPLGRAGMELPDWVGEVVAWRRDAKQDAHRAIERGLQESARHGVTSIGEIATPGSWPTTRRPRADVTVFHEVLAPSEARAEQARREVAEFSEQVAREQPDWRPGLSPHAPYTVGPAMIAELATLAREKNWPLACHLAESRAERELLAHGTGPWAERLAALGASWPRDAYPDGARPLDVMRLLDAAPRVLAIHGNYLDEDERRFVAERADRWAVVYCPRTHAFFGHERWPLEALLDAGATVALGTDGRGSNPDLSLLAELRFVARNYPSLLAARVIELGTIAGARALGTAAEVGSLTPGRWANLAVVPLAAGGEADPLANVLHSQSQVAAAIYRGHVAYWHDKAFAVHT